MNIRLRDVGEFSQELEQYLGAIHFSVGGRTVTIPGPDTPDLFTSDSSDPYSWTLEEGENDAFEDIRDIIDDWYTFTEDQRNNAFLRLRLP